MNRIKISCVIATLLMTSTVICAEPAMSSPSEMIINLHHPPKVENKIVLTEPEGGWPEYSEWEKVTT